MLCEMGIALVASVCVSLNLLISAQKTEELLTTE